MNQVDTFNRYMMTLARESRGLTQSGLAKLMGVGQASISKFENGTTQANDLFIRDLASTLNYNVEFFYEIGRPYGMPSFNYRKRKKLSQKALNKIIAEMNIRRIHLDILLKSYELDSNGLIPEIDRDEYIGGSKKPFSIENVANSIRDMWMLPDGPIHNVIELLEEKGAVVIPCNFNSDLIDAVCQRVDGMPVLFYINMNVPADRMRLTLCHELAHSVLHTTTILDNEEMEKEADFFAGSFLLPAEQIRSHLVKFDIRQVANLKKYWKVSMAAIAMRAFNLGLITPYQKKSFFINMSKLGYRKNEPYEPEKEYPQTIARIISYHMEVLKYSCDEMAKMLFISVEEFHEMYGTEPSWDSNNNHKKNTPNLRIVK